jgi:hypothetical protein
MSESVQQVCSGSSIDSLDAATTSADREFSANDAGSAVVSCRTFIEILVINEEGEPVTDQKYRLVLTDGSVQKGALGSDGRIFVDSIPRGDCTITFEPMIGYGVPEREAKRTWESEVAEGDFPAVDHSRQLS